MTADLLRGAAAAGRSVRPRAPPLVVFTDRELMRSAAAEACAASSYEQQPITESVAQHCRHL